MKKILFLYFLIINTFTSYSQTFSTTDLPTFYVYIFTSYNDTIFYSTTTQSKEEPNIKTTSTFPIEIPNIKITSSIVTSAISKWKVKVVVESIQKRYQTENLLELVKGSAPKDADFLVIGEHSKLDAKHLIDLKFYDVSQQLIIEQINVDLNELLDLREALNSEIDNTLLKILMPHLGIVGICVNYDTLTYRINWDDVSIRSTQSENSGSIQENTDKDYLHYSSFDSENSGENIKSKYSNIFKIYKNRLYLVGNGASTISTKPTISTKDNAMALLSKTTSTIKTITSPQNSLKYFIAGEYKIRIFQTNNGVPLESIIKVEPGKINIACFDFKVTLPPPPLPPPPPPLPTIGNIQILNLLEGYIVDIYKVETIIQEKTTMQAVSVGDSVSVTSKDTIDIDVKSIFKAYREGEKLIVFPNSWYNYTYQTSTVLLKNIHEGKYKVYIYSTSQESFPGKQYLKYYKFSKTVAIDVRGETEVVNIPPPSFTAGREVIIYFDPFPSTNEEEYKIYEGSEMLASLKNVGEVHLINYPINAFDTSFTVSREGYEKATIKIPTGNYKFYGLANLSNKKQEAVSPVKNKPEAEQNEKKKDKFDVKSLW